MLLVFDPEQFYSCAYKIKQLSLSKVSRCHILTDRLSKNIGMLPFSGFLKRFYCFSDARFIITCILPHRISLSIRKTLQIYLKISHTVIIFLKESLLLSSSFSTIFAVSITLRRGSANISRNSKFDWTYDWALNWPIYSGLHES